MKNLLKTKLGPLRPDKKLYRLAVGTVIGLIFFNQLLIQYILNQQWYDAKTISMAARQRLLCHQIVDLIAEDSVSSAPGNELKSLSEEWNNVHLALQNGNSELGIARLDSDEVRGLFAQANPYQFKIYDQATGSYKLGDIDDLEQSAEHFNAAMQKIVNKCEAHSASQLSATIAVEVALALVTLLVLLIEIKYIFRPAFSRIRKQQLQLRKENSTLTKTQDLLQAIQDSSSLAIIVVDEALRIISLNKKAVRNFRFVQNQKIKTGRYILDFIPAHIKEDFEQRLRLVLEGKSNTAEYCILNNKNKTRWYEIEFHPMKEEGQQINGAAFSVKDITRNKEYEIDLEQQNERLKKIAFLQAHELRGPITSMMGLINLISQESNDSNGSGYQLDKSYIAHFRNLSGKVDKIIQDIVTESENPINDNHSNNEKLNNNP